MKSKRGVEGAVLSFISVTIFREMSRIGSKIYVKLMQDFGTVLSNLRTTKLPKVALFWEYFGCCFKTRLVALLSF
jgi:hypothetical protein